MCGVLASSEISHVHFLVEIGCVGAECCTIHQTFIKGATYHAGASVLKFDKVDRALCERVLAGVTLGSLLVGYVCGLGP